MKVRIDGGCSNATILSMTAVAASTGSSPSCGAALTHCSTEGAQPKKRVSGWPASLQ